jgi:hypothetical protein
MNPLPSGSFSPNALSSKLHVHSAVFVAGSTPTRGEPRWSVSR